FLDEVVFERKSFSLVSDHNGFEVGNFARQGAGLGVDPARLGEVGAHAAAQVPRFAHIQDRPTGVLEEIDTWSRRQLGGLFAGLHGRKQRSVIRDQFSVSSYHTIRDW